MHPWLSEALSEGLVPDVWKYAYENKKECKAVEFWITKSPQQGSTARNKVQDK